jgi:2-polyprenyl-3-methyl-5-hydroxy-6-metoxy-1,4-benzoquinol methylase
MANLGLRVYAMDFDSPSISFLKWRLRNRKIEPDLVTYVDVKDAQKLPPADMVWVVDVLEHMVKPAELVEKLDSKTRVFAAFIDADDKASGRHPFHLGFNLSDFSHKLSEFGFDQVEDDLLYLWER